MFDYKNGCTKFKVRAIPFFRLFLLNSRWQTVVISCQGRLSFFTTDLSGAHCLLFRSWHIIHSSLWLIKQSLIKLLCNKNKGKVSITHTFSPSVFQHLCHIWNIFLISRCRILPFIAYQSHSTDSVLSTVQQENGVVLFVEFVHPVTVSGYVIVWRLEKGII